MTANHNPESGIAYGYISANALHGDIVQTLQDNGTNVTYGEALKEFLAAERKKWESEREGDDVPVEDEEFDESAATDRFNDGYMADEEVHEGEYEGVKYRTSWLGGALNVWVFDSPHITHLARQCSPCVPGAGDLDNLDGNYTCYDVPPDWRDTGNL